MRYEYRSGKFAELYVLFTVLWVAASLAFFSMLIYALEFHVNCTGTCPENLVLRGIGFSVMFLSMSLYCLGNAVSLHVTSDSKAIVKRYDRLWIGPHAKQALIGLHVLWLSLAKRSR